MLAQEAIGRLIDELHKSAQTILVLNRVDGRDGLVEQAAKALAPMAPNSLVRVKQRVAYKRADTEAKAATEIDKEAAAEIADLWKQIQRVVRKTDGQAARHEQPAKIGARARDELEAAALAKVDGKRRLRKDRTEAMTIRLSPQRRAQLVRLSDALGCAFIDTVEQGLDALEAKLRAGGKP